MSALANPVENQPPSKAEILEAMLWVPSDFKDYTHYKQSVGKALMSGVTKAVFKLTIQSKRFENGERTRINIKAKDAAGSSVDMAIFDSAAFEAWKGIPINKEVFVEAVPSDWNGNLQLKNPVLITSDQQGKVVPVYKGRKGLTAQDIAWRISMASQADLEAAVKHMEAVGGLPQADLLKLGGCQSKSLTQLLFSMHAPRTVAEAEAAVLEARQLAARHIIYASAKSNARPDDPKSVITIDSAVLNKLSAGLPFKLSAEQIQAVKQVVADLALPKPMNRILTGDVGTGKTAVFALIAAACQGAGKRVAILVPNQLLVRQIAEDCARWWPDIPVQQITSGDKIQNIEQNPILIGTTALIFQVRKNRNWQADLIVCDEQHKQSTRIREALLHEHTNLLEATATPIPRSAALVAYSGMGVSVLRQCPVKKTIHSRIASPADRESLLRHIAQLVGDGGQVAIIYPRVSDEANQRGSVEQAAQSWEKLLPNRVGVLHGRMSDDEKAAVITRMKQREIDCLVSSTVIEVGVQLPDLVCLVVVSPDRYGVAQLHQMRGRVARMGGEGFFYMLNQAAPSAETLERLGLLVAHQDGFTLAEKDAELRGYGDISSGSDQQSGATRGIFESIRLMPADFQHVAGT